MLQLLCEAAEAPAGQLYRAEGERLAHVASRGAAAEPALSEFATRYLAQQREDAMYSEVLTELSQAVTREPSVGSWTGPTGTCHRLLALTAVDRGELRFTGLVALHLPTSAPIPPRLQIMARVFAPYLGQSMV